MHTLDPTVPAPPARPGDAEGLDTAGWDAAVVTDVGLVRTGNEDAAYLDSEMALVADGLGGHAGGEVASRLALEVVAAHLLAIPRHRRTGADVRAAVTAAHAAVLDLAAADPHLHGMGTTLTGLVRTANALVCVNVGDSRTYRVDPNGPLVQLTRDDSLVANLVDAGVIGAEFAPFHPQRNVVTAAVGLPGSRLPVAVRLLSPAAVRYVLCSDGLSDVVDAAGLQAQARDAADPARSPEEAAEALVALALAGGGPDNVTVAVVDLP